MLHRVLAWAVLAVLAGSPGAAQFVVCPAHACMLAGETHTFRVREATGQGTVPGLPGALLPPGDWSWRIPDGGAGLLDEATGAFTAPALDQPATVRIQARYRPCPEVAGEALLLILPHEVFHLMDKVFPEWIDPYSSALPFLDPVTKRRSADGRRIAARKIESSPGPATSHGYGMPFTLTWTPMAGNQLLTLVQGNETLRLEASGQAAQDLTLTGNVRHCTVEGLLPPAEPGGLWRSEVQTFTHQVVGVVPLAGNAVAEPGHADGLGVSARFREPFGLARIFLKDGAGEYLPAFLVTDPQSHVVRAVSAEGDVLTPFGRPGEAGHRDATGPGVLKRLAASLCRKAVRASQVALFNRPTFLLPRILYAQQDDGTWGRTWSCYLADSGNHVLRLLHQDGTTATLAGSPGRAGHRDAPRMSRALFNNPQGLAVDGDGTLYVADQGNRVIRRITREGRVETLAGSPGQAGSADGAGSAARFTRLMGLAYNDLREDPALFAVDGHAIRRISLPGGEVTTVVGRVDTPGHVQVQGGTLEDRRQALRQPCLDNPCGILRCDPDLFGIADSGNNVVRSWVLSKALLRTVAGDPLLKETRWGLLRFGLEVPLDERYAGCSAPRTLVESGGGSYLVTTGCCLGDLVLPRDLKNMKVTMEPQGPVRAAEPCAIRFLSADADGGHGIGSRTFQYTMDFMEADGTRAERVTGEGITGTTVTGQGTFHQPGGGSVIVRCVTEQGISAGARHPVLVE